MKDGGWLNKYEAPQAENGIEGTMGGLTDVGFNYNGAWGGPSMAMGGSLPGSVGFTYARIQGSAPANGKYTKKTKASAQNGAEMSFYQNGLDWKPRNISRDGAWLDKYEDAPQSQDGTYVKKPRTDMLTMSEAKKQEQENRFLNAIENQPVIQSPKGKQLTKEQILAKNKQTAEAQGKRFNPETGAVTPFLSPSTARTFERASENIVEPMIDIEMAMSAAPLVGQGLKSAGKFLTEKTVSNIAKTSKQKLSGFEKDAKEALRQLIEESPTINKTELSNKKPASREEIKKFLQKLDEEDSYDLFKKPEPTFGSMMTDKVESENYLRNFPKETRRQSDELKQLFDKYDEDVNILKKDPEEADPFGIVRDLKNDPEAIWNWYGLYSPGETKKMLPITLKGGPDYMNLDLTGGGRQLLGERGEGIFKKGADDFGKFEQVKPWQIFDKEFFMRKNKNGGITKDDNGYWNPDNWGEPVEIGSNNITMQGVYEPLLGISDEGDTKMMYPGKDYKFKGKKVREYPISKNGGWLDKYK
jgi:hypothetical protein